MAINLILLEVNNFSTTSQWRARIYSDCMSVLVTMACITANQIPCQCKHSYILKNIMVNCRDLTFAWSYSHVKAHLDDNMSYQYLSRPSQLKCIMDYHANNVIWGLEGLHLPAQEIFLFEPVAIFVVNEKMTSNIGDSLWLWIHQQLAKEIFFKLGILTPLDFKKESWRLV